MHRVCVRTAWLPKDVRICLELEGCTSVGEAIEKALKTVGMEVNLELIAVGSGKKLVKIDEDVCNYDELQIYRLFHGG
ncbi:MAG: hypothetical protein QXS42_04100 [Zestosphaera sp.]